MKMIYGGLELKVNPKEFKISMNKEIAKHFTVYANQLCEENGKVGVVVSGKGYLIGEDACDKAFELVRLFNKKGSDYLFLPNSMPLKMYFSSLDISYSSGDDRVEYSFEFIQQSNTKKETKNPKYTYANDGENLFDIAGRTGVHVDSLVKQNDIGDIFAVKEGDRIWLI